MAHASSTEITFATAIVHEDLTAGGPKKVDTTEHYELHNKALGLLLETLKHGGFTGFQPGNAQTSNATLREQRLPALYFGRMFSLIMRTTSRVGKETPLEPSFFSSDFDRIKDTTYANELGSLSVEKWSPTNEMYAVAVGVETFLSGRLMAAPGDFEDSFQSPSVMVARLEHIGGRSSDANFKDDIALFKMEHFNNTFPMKFNYTEAEAVKERLEETYLVDHFGWLRQQFPNTSGARRSLVPANKKQKVDAVSLASERKASSLRTRAAGVSAAPRTALKVEDNSVSQIFTFGETPSTLGTIDRYGLEMARLHKAIKDNESAAEVFVHDCNPLRTETNQRLLDSRDAGNADDSKELLKNYQTNKTLRVFINPGRTEASLNRLRSEHQEDFRFAHALLMQVFREIRMLTRLNDAHANPQATSTLVKRLNSGRSNSVFCFQDDPSVDGAKFDVDKFYGALSAKPIQSASQKDKINGTLFRVPSSFENLRTDLNDVVKMVVQYAYASAHEVGANVSAVYIFRKHTFQYDPDYIADKDDEDLWGAMFLNERMDLEVGANIADRGSVLADIAAVQSRQLGKQPSFSGLDIGKLHYREKAPYLEAIWSLLAKMSSVGIVNMDAHLGNVMLSGSDKIVAKLIDFDPKLSSVLSPSDYAGSSDGWKALFVLNGLFVFFVLCVDSARQLLLPLLRNALRTNSNSLHQAKFYGISHERSDLFRKIVVEVKNGIRMAKKNNLPLSLPQRLLDYSWKGGYKGTGLDKTEGVPTEFFLNPFKYRNAHEKGSVDRELVSKYEDDPLLASVPLFTENTTREQELTWAMLETINHNAFSGIATFLNQQWNLRQRILDKMLARQPGVPKGPPLTDQLVMSILTDANAEQQNAYSTKHELLSNINTKSLGRMLRLTMRKRESFSILDLFMEAFEDKPYPPSFGITPIKKELPRRLLGLQDEV